MRSGTQKHACEARRDGRMAARARGTTAGSRGGKGGRRRRRAVAKARGRRAVAKARGRRAVARALETTSVRIMNGRSVGFLWYAGTGVAVAVVCPP